MKQLLAVLPLWALLPTTTALGSTPTTHNRRTSIATSSFSPLTCNDSLQSSVCIPWSTFFGATDFTITPTTIPCNTCVTMSEFTLDDEVLNLPQGLNIIGKLVMPLGTKIKIVTPSIIVQGLLEIDAKTKVDGSPDIHFVLEGNTDILFRPEAPNEGSCPNGGCNLGSKPVVVAGGKLDIRGLPESCPTWIRLSSVGRANVTSLGDATTYESAPEPPRNASIPCERSLIDQDFESGLDGWYGNVGPTEELTSEGHTSQYMKVRDRNIQWQGPIFELRSQHKECLIANQRYLFSAQIRLSRPDGQSSLCSTTGERCIAMNYTNMNSENRVRWTSFGAMSPSDAVSDGEWFTFRTTFEFTDDHLRLDDVFSAIVLQGPEAGVDIDIDDIHLRLPPPEAYINGSCENLIPNGDAEQVDGFAYPFESWFQKETLVVKYDDVTKNHYFHLGNRAQQYSTMTFELEPSCAASSSIYHFATMIWIHSAEPVAARAVLKTHHVPDAQDLFHFDPIVTCPESSESIGWVLCESDFEFGDVHEASPKMEFLMITPNDMSDVDYDDLEFSHKFGAEGGNEVPPEAIGCWGAQSEIMVTSESIVFDAVQTGVIERVGEDGSVEWSVDTPSSTEETEHFAGEIALLSRNILFEAENDVEFAGGYLSILRTEGVKQILEGVRFKNFGVQGEPGKYPINLYRSADAASSLISKNSITQSNQRCIVLHGTQNAIVSHNVAYDTYGHCYALEDGSETDNTFEYNLGAVTKKIVSTMNPIANEADGSPATFMITNPNNRYVGNVAAGSQDSGYWFWLKPGVTGETAKLYDVSPQKSPVLLFDGNVAHSNFGNGIKTHPNGYYPASPSLIQNSKVYRNRGIGMYMHLTTNVTISGGIYADNKIGIDVNYADTIQIRDVDVVGYSEHYKTKAVSDKLPRHCWGEDSNPLYGVRLHVNLMDNDDDGVTLSNVNFSGFRDDLQCPGSKSLIMNDNFKEQAFNNKILLEQLSFDEEDVISNKISLCDAAEANIKDVLLTDDGSLNPNGAEPGIVVSDNDVMTTLAGNCTVMTGSCAQYCIGEGSCMTKVILAVESSDTDGTVLVIDDGTGQTSTIEGIYTPTGGNDAETNWNERRYFSASLSSGNYTAHFEDSGVLSWPVFAELSVTNPPTCDKHMDSFELTKPPTSCDTLVRNGDFEATSDIFSSGWHDTGGSIQLVPNTNSGGNAISTNGRTDPAHGIAQFLDSRCMTSRQRYDITAKVRLTGAETCTPFTVPAGADRCPRASVRSFHDDSYIDMLAVADTLSPFAPDAWNELIGIIEINDAMQNADGVALFFDGVREGVDILLDDVVVAPRVEDCANVIMNGDFEVGDPRYWIFLGPAVEHATGIEIVENSRYGGSGYSLKTLTRSDPWHVMAQHLNRVCMEEGKEYEVSMDYRLETTAGEPFECDPYLNYAGMPKSCPRPALKLEHGPSDETYIDIAVPIGPNTPGQWNKALGVFTATPDIMTAPHVEFYIGKSHPSNNLIVDNIVIKPAGAGVFGIHRDCTQLVVNGDAEIGDARYWSIKGQADQGYGRIDMVSPGAGGSNFAFNHHGGRTRNFHGLWQTIDQDCMPEGSTWKITAEFRLFDSSGNEVGCDKTKGGGPARCPMFLFQSHTTGEPVHYDPPLKNLSPGGWNIGGWNEYENTFTMTSEHKAKERTWFYIHHVLPGYSYYVDNISIVPAGGEVA